MGVDYYLTNTATGYRNVGAVIILRRLVANQLSVADAASGGWPVTQR